MVLHEQLAGRPHQSLCSFAQAQSSPARPQVAASLSAAEECRDGGEDLPAAGAFEAAVLDGTAGSIAAAMVTAEQAACLELFAPNATQAPPDPHPPDPALTILPKPRRNVHSPIPHLRSEQYLPNPAGSSSPRSRRNVISRMPQEGYLPYSAGMVSSRSCRDGTSQIPPDPHPSDPALTILPKSRRNVNSHFPQLLPEQ